MAPSPSNYYVPGNSRRKLCMIGYGALLFLLGSSQIWSPLGLILFGASAQAEAIVAIKTKKGLPDKILTDDYQIQKELEPHDRSYIFWNIFRFHLSNGQTIDVRCPIGSTVKPLFPLSDSDGLPTTSVVYYSPTQPDSIVFPLIISTWLAPGVLLLAGFICMLVGGTLYYWANKPILLPHTATPSYAN